MKTLIRIMFGSIVLSAVALASQPPKPVEPAAPATSPAELYRAECGSCHIAYPEGLLPRASWQRLLGGLEDHFGENAELDAPTRAIIESWLVANAAEAGRNKRGRKILRALDEPAPLRISQTKYILRKHEDVRTSVFERPSVGSRAQCAACHPDAERGDFDDDRVKIPK